jgi:hypothetical protein
MLLRIWGILNKMRMKIISIIITFFIVYSGIAQDNKSLIVIRHEGNIDKPIYPLVICYSDFDSSFVKEKTKMYGKQYTKFRVIKLDSISYHYVYSKVCANTEIKSHKKGNSFGTFSVSRYENGKEIRTGYLTSIKESQSFFLYLKGLLIELENKDGECYYLIDEILDRLNSK